MAIKPWGNRCSKVIKPCDGPGSTRPSIHHLPEGPLCHDWGYLPSIMVTKGYILGVITRYITHSVHLFSVWICPVRSFFSRDWHGGTVSEPSCTLEMEVNCGCVEKTLGLLVGRFLCSRYSPSQDIFPFSGMVSKSNRLVPYTYMYWHCVGM